MKVFLSNIRLIFMVTREWFRWFLGGYDELLYALLIFVVADYITCVMCAIADKKISTDVGVRGIVKKGLIFLLVGIANILDMQVVIGTNSVLRTAIIFFYISSTGMSLLRNIKLLGLPIPEKLKEILEQLYEK